MPTQLNIIKKIMPKLIDELSAQLDQLSLEIAAAEQNKSLLIADKKILEYIIKDLQERQPEKSEALASKQQELTAVIRALEENQIILTAKRITFAEVKTNLIAEAQQATIVIKILQNTIEQLSSSIQHNTSIPEKAKRLTTDITEFTRCNEHYEELLDKQEKQIEALSTIIETRSSHQPTLVGNALCVLGKFALKEVKTTATPTLTINDEAQVLK